MTVQLDETYVAIRPYLVDHPLATTREVAEACGVSPKVAYHRLTMLYTAGQVARQPAFTMHAKQGAPQRWQVTP